MSGPDQSQPPTPVTPGGAPAARNASLAALILVGLMCCACCGGIGFAVYLVSSHADVRQAVGEMKQQLASKAGIAPSPNADWEQWMIDSALSPAYTAALDAVAADPQVIERLGQGIGADFEAEELYRRKRSGALRTEGETIEFDVVGAQESAVVTVEIVGAGQQRFAIESITVTLDDGTEFSVPPPPEQTYRVQ